MFFLCMDCPYYCLCFLLIGSVVSFVIFYSHIENYATVSYPRYSRVVIADRAKCDYGAENSNAENGRPDYVDDGEIVENPVRPADECPADGDRKMQTVCSYALCAMAVCMFAVCNVFPEYCFRKRIRLEKPQHLTVRKECGCVTVYGQVDEWRDKRTAGPLGIV